MSAVMQASIQMELSEPASALLKPDMTAQMAVQALVGAGQIQDALKLLARLLPKRYAVAWLCQCARDQPLNPEDKAGASLAEKWVREPNESNRRAAYEFATAGGYKSAGAWVAAAAGWSGGSLAPASQETPVPPPDHLTACAAVAAINMLAALVIEKFEVRRAGFIEPAMNLLNAGGASAGGQ
ncbi:hypothetical protein GCM10008098_04300 [Rhodanobacter panaciterrae]|uniref:Secreted protein n=1 Tax=Rhodanobacter panaciterrae TaxID=490572 RepID=A0ABQ2ZJW3_9GAMM|nr:hypothetical protein [Rhodanobacter panaciterrae]GGY16211.1 hypothetical protein GCM10008098_04300 [Rhodanobacter panaciterrae]